MRYRKNEPNVISETMGEETIIVNLASGHYFSLQGANVTVWDCLERGYGEEEIAGHVSELYDAGDADVGGCVSALVAQLLEEELIAPRDEGDEPAAPLAGSGSTEGAKRPFSMPPLSKFTDMQDIILLDPVHEVDARGWPHAPATG
jgi:hypothetical protein